MTRVAVVAMAVSSAGSLKNTLREGLVLEYVAAGGKRKLGVVVRADGKKNWMVEDKNGAAVSIAPKQIAFVAGEVGGEIGGDLEKIEIDCEEKVAENEELLEVAWEIIAGSDEPEAATVETVSEIVFGGTDAPSLYATHAMLSRDNLFFKSKTIKGVTLYAAKAAGLVTEARLLLEFKANREKEEKALADAIISSYKERTLDGLRNILGTNEVDSVVLALQSIADELEDGPRAESRFTSNPVNSFRMLEEREKKAVRQILETLDMSILPSSAFDVLVAWGVFSRHENLALRKAGLQRDFEFDDALLQAADALLADVPMDLDADRRRDFTALPSYAIDSADTVEVDDAMSWDAAEKRVWVHIADPTRYFPTGPQHPLVKEALRRVATLYLPTGKLTMFPQSIVTSLFSLDGEHTDGSALSFGFRIADDDGAIEEDSIVIEPTRISPPIRLTYEQAEIALADSAGGSVGSDLRALLDKAQKRMEWREMEGAILINSPFAQVSVGDVQSDHPTIELGSLSTKTKSWTLVSELMVTASTIAGLTAQNSGIPVPFRGQEPFEYPEDEVLEAIPDGPARAALAFRNASPSEVRTEATFHASLAVETYVQVTSPIRRSGDLLSHFQLKATLRKAPELPFSTDAVQSEIGRSNEMGRTLRNVENRTNKYWQLEYLRRGGPNAVYKGMYVRQLRDSDDRLGLVHLEDYAFSLVVGVPPGTRPGTLLTVKVPSANARTGSSTAEATLPASETAADMTSLLDDMFSDVASDEDFP